MNKALLVLTILLIPSLSYAQSGNTSLIPLPAVEGSLKATCRVNRGTGVAFREEEKTIWILTAAHCIANDDGQLHETYVQFFSNGYQSHKMKAVVAWHIYESDQDIVRDLAVLKVKKADFKTYPLPKIMPLARKQTRVSKGNLVFSCGCPRSGWPTAWIGHLKHADERVIKVVPPPLPGRSGSAVYNKEGEIVGIILRRDGKSISHKEIYKLAEKWVSGT